MISSGYSGSDPSAKYRDDVMQRDPFLLSNLSDIPRTKVSFASPLNVSGWKKFHFWSLYPNQSRSSSLAPVAECKDRPRLTSRNIKRHMAFDVRVGTIRESADMRAHPAVSRLCNASSPPSSARTIRPPAAIKARNAIVGEPEMLSVSIQSIQVDCVLSGRTPSCKSSLCCICLSPS